MEPKRIDPDLPLWDQKSFYGRLRHFFWMTDYRSCMLPTKRYSEAKKLIDSYKEGTEPVGTTDQEIKYAMKLYQQAFHPDSGELQNFMGRMSFQVPGGMFITGALLQFYKTNLGVVSWQWINQSFNALVNYTNRNAASEISTKRMFIAYASATSSALIAALGFKAAFKKTSSPIFQRFVPFIALAVANMVNIPLTRQSELQDGIVMIDENGDRIGQSKFAAVKGISQVVFSRITIAAPGMLILPFIMESLEKRKWFMRHARYHVLFQMFMVGCSLTFMVPIGCALFPQKSEVRLQTLSKFDKKCYEDLRMKYGEKTPEILYFNKGL